MGLNRWDMVTPEDTGKFFFPKPQEMERVLCPSQLSLFFSFCCSGPYSLRNTHIRERGDKRRAKISHKSCSLPSCLIPPWYPSLHQDPVLCEPSNCSRAFWLEASPSRQMRGKDRGHTWVHLPLWQIPVMVMRS